MLKVLSRSAWNLTPALLAAASISACAGDESAAVTTPAQSSTAGTSAPLGAASAGTAAAAAASGSAQPPRAGSTGQSSGSATAGRAAAAGSGVAGSAGTGAPPLTAAGTGGTSAPRPIVGRGDAGSQSPCSPGPDGTPVAGCTAPGGGEPSTPDGCKVGPIPDDVRAEYKLNAFYTRYASADGTPVVATDKPVDESITRACQVVLDLSSTHPMARQRMRNDHVYFIMMAKTEKTVQTPEYKSRGDLDARARGFGNNPGLCAEENVMCDRSTDRWRGESICVHEYSHVMHLYVWNKVVPMFDSKVTAAYNNAVRSMGKYPNTYAASNAVEYFAEGVQDWYNTNLQSPRGEAGDGVHNHINTRTELKEYDPMLYEILTGVLPDVPKYKDCYYYGP